MKSLRKRKMFKLYAQQHRFKVEYKRFKYTYPNPDYGKTLATQYAIYKGKNILTAYVIIENTPEKFQKLYNRFKEDVKKCSEFLSKH